MNYSAAINSQVSKAIKLVHHYRITYPNSENLAAVFDVDGTLLDSTQKPIQPVVYLYNLCKQLGITVFIITARESGGIEETIDQLHRVGINGFHSVYFRMCSSLDVGRFKRSSRKSVLDKGFYTLFSIGDTFWDIGDFGGHGILLPSCD